MNEDVSSSEGGRVPQRRKNGTVGQHLRELGADGLKVALSFMPGLGGPTIEALNVVEARAQRRQADLLFSVIDRLDTDLAVLEQLLNDDGDLADLWVRGMQAARTAQTDRKIEAFAAILSAFARRETLGKSAPTLASVMLRVLESLDEEHIEILAIVDSFADETPSPDGDDETRSVGISAERLGSASNYPATVVAIILDSLLSLQLVRDTYEGTWAGLEGKGAYALTALGANLLAMLRVGHGETPAPRADAKD
ncbi:hypothetical protein ACIA49_35230 [Kribbella sp. NPDC051587]|uniref:hypothetical protein n=1 Tax=Kribbella sp. NPDC051587 TaxID=3364119 RepID=UPI00379DD1D9